MPRSYDLFLAGRCAATSRRSLLPSARKRIAHREPHRALTKTSTSTGSNRPIQKRIGPEKSGDPSSR